MKDLTYIEEQLIAQVHPILSVYRIRGGQYGYRGQVINFPQDVNELGTELPHAIETVARYVVIRRNTSAGYRDFFVKRSRVLNALNWLKAHNRFYHDIHINHHNLYALPEDEESIFNRIQLSQRQTSQNNDQDESADSSDSDAENDTAGVFESGAPDWPLTTIVK